MKRIPVFCTCALLLILHCRPAEKTQMGIQVNPDNSRYFIDAQGKAIYLTGSHTWNNGMADIGPDDPPGAMDYEAYLNWMIALNHNFMRMWTWELTNWNTSEVEKSDPPALYVAPHPWLRTGPGNARDAKARFDLSQWNPAYFERLRTRVEAARAQGIYTSIMLFEGWGPQFSKDGWQFHPFNGENNINGIDGDKNRDGFGHEIYQLEDPAIRALQEAYIIKVIETVNDLDNVLYEISNENHINSTEWQYHMIDFIHQYEQKLPRQHPVGMTFQYKGGRNEDLFNSPADWISPNGEGGYTTDPPADNRGKIIITDTDHLWGIGGNVQWIWKSFLRGLNPIFMDPYDRSILHGPEDTTWLDPIRRNLGYTRTFAERIDLLLTPPRPDLASSTYCLANPGTAYLVYLPGGAATTVDLRDFSHEMQVEWFDPASGTTQKSAPVAGGPVGSFESVFGSDGAGLYFYRTK